jgi:hypothetical protein
LPRPARSRPRRRSRQVRPLLPPRSPKAASSPRTASGDYPVRVGQLQGGKGCGGAWEEEWHRRGIRRPREEERAPNAAGPEGPKEDAVAPGRRRGATAVSDDPREEERVTRKDGALGPAVKGRRCQGGGGHRR